MNKNISGKFLAQDDQFSLVLDKVRSCLKLVEGHVHERWFIQTYTDEIQKKLRSLIQKDDHEIIRLKYTVAEKENLVNSSYPMVKGEVEKTVNLIDKTIIEHYNNLTDSLLDELALFLDKVSGYTEYRLLDSLYYRDEIDDDDIEELSNRLAVVTVNPLEKVGGKFEFSYERYDDRAFKYERAMEKRDSRIAANFPKGKNPHYIKEVLKEDTYNGEEITEADLIEYEMVKVTAKRRSSRIAEIENRVASSLLGKFAEEKVSNEMKKKASQLASKNYEKFLIESKKKLEEYEKIQEAKKRGEMVSAKPRKPKILNFLDFNRQELNRLRKAEIVEYLTSNFIIPRNEANVLAQLTVERPDVIHMYGTHYARPIDGTLTSIKEGISKYRVDKG